MEWQEKEWRRLWEKITKEEKELEWSLKDIKRMKKELESLKFVQPQRPELKLVKM